MDEPKVDTKTRNRVELWRAAAATGSVVVVIGDVILDRFDELTEIGKSRECPGVPETRRVRQNSCPGGAGNTVGNIVSLGGKAEFSSVVGTRLGERDRQRVDSLSSALQAIGVATGGLIPDRNRQTPRKLRVFLDGVFILSDNDETRIPIDETVRRTLMARLTNTQGAKAVVVSDYGRGVITPDLMAGVRGWCKDTSVPLLIDPRPQKDQTGAWLYDYFALYAGATLVKPNAAEAEVLLRRTFDKADNNEAGQAAADLRAKLGGAVLITRERYGMTLADPSGSILHLPAVVKDQKDVKCVSGCGDTIMAVIALALSANAGLEEAVRLASVAAGIAVRKPDTATVAATELKAELEGWWGNP